MIQSYLFRQILNRTLKIVKRKLIFWLTWKYVLNKAIGVIKRVQITFEPLLRVQRATLARCPTVEFDFLSCLFREFFITYGIFYFFFGF